MAHLEHRGGGGGRAGVRRLHHQQRRGRGVQAAARPRRHPRAGGRRAAGQGDNEQGVISAKSVWERFIGVKKVCDKIWQKLL